MRIFATCDGLKFYLCQILNSSSVIVSTAKSLLYNLTWPQLGMRIIIMSMREKKIKCLMPNLLPSMS